MIRLLKCFGFIFAVALVVLVYRGLAAQAAATTLIAYWHLDEATGPTYNDAANNHDGTCTSCPTAIPGQRSGAQLFDGSSNEVNVLADPAFDWSASASFSIELWVQAQPNQTCITNVSLIGRGDASGVQRWSVGCSGGSGRATFYLGDGGSNIQLQSTRVITDGLWHHVVAQRDGATDQNWLIVDGTDVVSNTHDFSGSFAPAAAAIHIGHYHNGAHFGSTLDEVALYDGALATSDILSHYYLVRNYDAACTTPISIMPLGDSITSGYGSGDFPTTPGYNYGYRRPLYLSLTGTGYDVEFVGGLQHGQLASGPPFDYDHEGHPGWFDEQIAPNVISFLSTNPADIVLLHIGTNDVASGQGPGVADVEQILINIDTFDPALPVVVARIIDQNPNHPQYEPGAVAAFNNNLEAMVLSRIAAGDKLILVDQENALNYATDMFSDRLHPNNLGYSKIADVWFDALDDFLPICTTPTDFTQRSETFNSDNKEGGVAWADYNGDNCPDVLVGTNERGYLYRGDCSSSVTTYNQVASFSDGSRVWGVAWADFDNDGDVDFARSRRQGVQLYRNNGGTFAAYGSELTGSDGSEMEGIGWLDYDADGDLDLFVDNQMFGLELFENSGLAGGFTFAAAPTALSGFPAGSGGSAGQENGDYAAVADYDHDGLVDVLVRRGGSVGGNNTIDIWHNDGAAAGGFFTPNSSANFAASNGNKGGVAWCDFDNDGDLDFYWTDNGTNQIVLQDNNGNFAAAPGSSPPTTSLTNLDGVACGDVDNDSDLDLFLVDSDADLLFLNQLVETGSPGWVQNLNAGISGANDGAGAAFADMDRDGDLDLLINQNGANELYANNHITRTDYVMVAATYDAAAAATGSGSRPALGSTVWLLDCAGVTLSGLRQVDGGSGHGSQEEPLVHFGLGTRSSNLPLVAVVQFVGGTLEYQAVIPGAMVGYRVVTVSSAAADNLTACGMDFGDLPAVYGNTLFGDGGARHSDNGLRLGTTWDIDANGQESSAADGDGADDDGVVRTGVWSIGNGPIRVNASGNGCLNVWIDWDNNGNFAGEQVFTNLPVMAGNNDLVVNVPGNVGNQSLYARTRLTPEDSGGGCSNAEAYAAGVATPAGAATGGEVEDYDWFFSPTALTLRGMQAQSGSAHLLVVAGMIIGLTFVTIILRRMTH